MSTNRKDDQLLKPSVAAKQLRVARNTVMHRIATQRYASEVVGGVTFVVVDERFLADVKAAEAEQEQATVAVA
jgi:hypothetical protein